MVKQKKERRSKRAIVGFVSLIAAVAVIVGVGYAYFSDVITGSGTATAGTLDIEGSMTLYGVDGQPATGNVIENLNPGDVIAVGATVTNVGNKSTWVQTCVKIDAASELKSPQISVYPASVTPAAILGGTAGDALTADAITGEFCSGSIAATQYVLDGTGTGAETGDATVTGTNKNVLTADATSPLFYIYFDKTAGNEYQAKDLGMTFNARAIQYRNNTTYPTDWSTAVSTTGVNSDDTNDAPDVQ